MFLLVHKNGIITLQSEEGYKIRTIGHKQTYYGVQALRQTAIPIKYA